MNDLAVLNHPYADVVAENTANLDLIRRTYAKELNDSEFQLVVAEGNSRGLSVLNREIVGIKFRGVMSTMVTLAGVRKLAERTGLIRGVEGPYWCGPDKKWHEVWLGSTPPVAAKFLIYRADSDRPVTAVATWEERAQYFFKDNKRQLGPTWAAMPALMLGKCAESDCYKRARLVADNLAVSGEDEAPDERRQATVREAAMRHVHQAGREAGMDHEAVRAVAKALRPGIESMTDPELDAADLRMAAEAIAAFGPEAIELIEAEPEAALDEGAGDEPTPREVWRNYVAGTLYAGTDQDRKDMIDIACAGGSGDAWRWEDLIEVAPNKAYRDRIIELARANGCPEAAIEAATRRRADTTQVARAAERRTEGG
jgi:hypothetical protein